ncbi:Hypothetical protein A7982_08189 [Minicystis rosea]|nr:Hypothetical protein A7982_08189 [Minicystis rosea]
MGSFFTNVHLRVAPGAPLAPVLDAIVELAHGEGFEPAGSAEPGDRAVVVLRDAGGWISIFDEATEGQDSNKLARLASALSRAAGAPAVSVLVHDSDVLLLGLFVDGAAVDSFDSNPSFSAAKPSATKRRKAAGHPERWAALLAPGATVEALAAAWASERLFAEQTLATTAALLGAPADRMGLGFRYFESTPAASRPAGEVTRLAFRLRARPAYELDAEGPVMIGTDLPPEYASERRTVALAVGDELRVSLGGRNQGGAGVGLSVIVAGDAITRGLVAVDTFELVVGDVMSGAKHQVITPVRKERDSAVALVARLPDRALPAGVRGGFAALAGASDFRKAHSALQRSAVHVNVVGRALVPGAGDLDIALVPDANPDEGLLAGGHRVDVCAPLYRPRRAPASTPSHELRPLAGRDALFAILVYGVDRARATEHARRAFTRLSAIAPPQGKHAVSVFFAEPGRRPKSGQFDASGFLTGRRWKALEAELRDEAMVQIGPALGPEDPPSSGTVSLAFGGRIIPDPVPGDRELPVLMLSIEVASLDEHSRAAARTALIEILDEAMRDLDGVQATLACWSERLGIVDSTSYERAAGVHGHGVTRASWATRWLRAVGNDTLWLGPALLAHLDANARAALEKAARLHEVGRALRAELPSPDRVADLEEAVDALLPGQDVYMATITKKR